MLFWTVVLISSLLTVLIVYIIRQYFRKRLPAANKAVLITGCDTGFGYLLAQRLSKLGYKVYAGCLSKESEGAKSLKSFIPKIAVLQLDVTNQDDIKSIRQHISEEQGEAELWAVVNNAGILQLGEFEWTPIEIIRKTFEVNTFGPVNVTKEVLPLLKKSQGRIVNTISVNAEVKVPATVAYCMSKAATKMFNDVIRLELKRWNIKVINISPHCYSTSIASAESFERSFVACWEKADPEITAAYGEEFLKEYIRIAKAGGDFLKNTHLEEVIDCMTDAITLESPNLRYRPGNLLNRIVYTIPRFLPDFLVDLIQFSKMPKLKNNRHRESAAEYYERKWIL